MMGTWWQNVCLGDIWNSARMLWEWEKSDWPRESTFYGEAAFGSRIFNPYLFNAPKAMVSWFPGWRSKRCAEGIKKWHFCFIFLIPTYRPADSKTFFRIENQTIINRDTATFVQQVQILHESFENKPKKFFFIPCFFSSFFLPFFFFPTDRLEILQMGKKIVNFQNFISFFFSTDRLYKKGPWKIRHPGNQPTMA